MTCVCVYAFSNPCSVIVLLNSMLCFHWVCKRRMLYRAQMFEKKRIKKMRCLPINQPQAAQNEPKNYPICSPFRRLQRGNRKKNHLTKVLRSTCLSNGGVFWIPSSLPQSATFSGYTNNSFISGEMCLCQAIKLRTTTQITNIPSEKMALGREKKIDLHIQMVRLIRRSRSIFLFFDSFRVRQIIFFSSSVLFKHFVRNKRESVNSI